MYLEVFCLGNNAECQVQVSTMISKRLFFSIYLLRGNFLIDE